jgi:hypothetical protein
VWKGRTFSASLELDLSEIHVMFNFNFCDPTWKKTNPQKTFLGLSSSAMAYRSQRESL